MDRFGFPKHDEVRPLIEMAMREDIGEGDVTSALLIEPDRYGRGVLVQKSAGVVAGLPIVPMICAAYDPRLVIEPVEVSLEGCYSDARKLPILAISGPLRSLLSAERVILNFMQRMSGVASMTRQYVDAVRGTSAKILDTRKTIPGFRLLDKYAVRAGGGHNHRIGLYDGVLVKDNHIAHIPLGELTGFLSGLVVRAREAAPGRMFMVEVDTLEQLDQVVKVDGVTHILLDNMPPATMAEAVRRRDAAGRRGQVELEASGGVNLSSVRAIAESGVDRISIGAITHSVPAMDIGLDVEE